MNRAAIQDRFWSSRLDVNARQAIFHQWRQLEASGCIGNFRIAAGELEGLREGWFFADSDAYKWLEAALRIHADRPDPQLGALIDDFIQLLARAQKPDGYLFTYNQIHFPHVRWHNLQIEHELYCHGHLIEAGVSGYETSGRTDLLDIARRAADRIVADFLGKGPAYTPGHEEIEIALLRLYQLAPVDQTYFEMARQFIEQRGRTPAFALSLFQQNLDVARRSQFVQEQKKIYLASHPAFQPFTVPPDNLSKKPLNTTLRWYASALSGKYFQQHKPVREQAIPVGHSVRFAYLEAAAAMLARISGDSSLVTALEQAWEHMLMRRMYLTGGVGSLPGLEGFGRDFELDPEYAYAETCAALGCLLWNWEMGLLTGQAKYSDLFEWQLYNAASVGMGLDGTSYFYNNPLACHGGLERRPWYAVPCCPSNLSRTWAGLGRFICSTAESRLSLHQYIGSQLQVDIPTGEGHIAKIRLELKSGLPWEGQASLKITGLELSDPHGPFSFELLLRQPAWAVGMRCAINGQPALLEPVRRIEAAPPASGYDPRAAVFQVFNRTWTSGDLIEIEFDMPVELRRAHPRVKGHQGKVALTRGPLVYCLEDLDNPGVDIFSARLEPGSLSLENDDSLLAGITRITGKTRTGESLIFIPYYLWGNRGPSRMTVWVNT